MSVFFFSPLTAQSTHRPDSIQFQPKASSVPSPPGPVWFSPLLIGQSPLQKAQPGGLSLCLCVGPFGVLGRFDPWGESGLLLWLAVQQVLQVVQGQKVIVVFQKLFHKLQEEGKGLNLVVRECTRENNSISNTFHYSFFLFFPALPPSPPSGLFFYVLYALWILFNPLFSFFSLVPPPLYLPPPVPAQYQEKGVEREPPWCPGVSGGAERRRAAQDTAWQQRWRTGKTRAGGLKMHWLQTRIILKLKHIHTVNIQ